MQCKNNPKKTYTGKENTPLGKGYSADKEKVGTEMKGRDRSLYVVVKIKNGKRWQKVSSPRRKTSPRRKNRSPEGFLRQLRLSGFSKDKLYNKLREIEPKLDMTTDERKSLQDYLDEIHKNMSNEDKDKMVKTLDKLEERLSREKAKKAKEAKEAEKRANKLHTLAKKEEKEKRKELLESKKGKTSNSLFKILFGSPKEQKKEDEKLVFQEKIRELEGLLAKQQEETPSSPEEVAPPPPETDFPSSSEEDESDPEEVAPPLPETPSPELSEEEARLNFLRSNFAKIEEQRKRTADAAKNLYPR